MTQPELNGMLNTVQAQASAVYGMMDAGVPDKVIAPVRKHISDTLRAIADDFQNTTEPGQGREGV